MKGSADLVHERRYGTFVVQSELLLANLGHLIFEGLVPIKVSFEPWSIALRVTALGEDFEPTLQGHEPAQYLLRIEGSSTTGYHRRFEKTADATPVPQPF